MEYVSLLSISGHKFIEHIPVKNINIIHCCCTATNNDKFSERVITNATSYFVYESTP